MVSAEPHPFLDITRVWDKKWAAIPKVITVSAPEMRTFISHRARHAIGAVSVFTACLR
jgi:hypothetical protein